jgi:hypothetical protein
VNGLSKDGIISNDGRTIATTTHTNRGWYEYAADAPS